MVRWYRRPQELANDAHMDTKPLQDDLREIAVDAVDPAERSRSS